MEGGKKTPNSEAKQIPKTCWLSKMQGIHAQN
jgi:hypothetical protein